MRHILNVQAFEKLAGQCTGWGGYNPGRQSLQVGALNDQLSRAQQAIGEVIVAKTRYDNVVNLRRQVFDGLPRLTSGVMRTLEASGAAREKLEDARAFVHRILGKVPGHRPPVRSEQAPPEGVRPERTKRQLAFVSKAHAFSGLVEAVLTEPSYMAYEPELSREGLVAMAEELHGLNTRVTEARIAWSNALVHRDQTMYRDTEAVVPTARRVKKYVRARYGFGSPEFAQVKGLVFSQPRQ